MPHLKRNCKILLVSVLALSMCLTGVPLPIQVDAVDSGTETSASNRFLDASYQQYLNEQGFNGTLSHETVNVPMQNCKFSDGMIATMGKDGLNTGGKGKITWSFTVKQTGFYNLEVGYIPLPGTHSDIQRAIILDGKNLYNGLSQISFKRHWRDDGIKAKGGNEILPKSVELLKESKVFVEDSDRRMSSPYLFYLTGGTHELTFNSIKEPVTLTSLTFCAMPTPPTYKEYLANSQGKPSYDGNAIVCQTERADGPTKAVEKSSPAIMVQTNYTDPGLVPYSPSKIVFNTIGASSWEIAGDYINWTVQAPKDGLYTLSFKGRQSINRGVTSYRRLTINGQVPFQEAKAIPFDYSNTMRNYMVSVNDRPAQIYLHAGENVIGLEVVLGDFGGALTEVEQSVRNLNQMYLKTIQLTSLVPDRYIDYEIASKIPDFVPCMQAESKRLTEVLNEVIKITGEKGEQSSIIQKMAQQAQSLAKDPESVVNQLALLKSNISDLGTWIWSISQMPLELDSLTLSAGTSNIPAAQSGLFARLINGIERFFSTFSDNKNDFSTGTSQKKSIKVWMVTGGTTATATVTSGREQAQIISNLVQEKFTPETGINVDLQLIPLDVVLSASLAGNNPDAIIGLSQTTLQDFAMRGALVDVSKLDGYGAMKEKFTQSAIDGASYLNGVYGLPEQQTFDMLFYRKDVMKQLNLKVPKTWDDVRTMIPVLQAHNYSFYMPNVELYPSLVYQYGGDMYNGKGSAYGISTALKSRAAMNAFKDLTDFFTNDKLLVQADFSNRFRTGEMPIGIASYSQYNQLEVFAPEIKGDWSFAPIPGVKNADGSVNNTFVTDTIQSVILKNSKQVGESWDFLKWWLSGEVQLQYANTIESVMGPAARYCTANKSVLKQLPWTNDDIEQLLAQMNCTKGIPSVPGSYMTTRMVQYAFNDVVTNSSNPRETLHLNLQTINQELEIKRKEFGLSVDQNSAFQ